MPIAIVGAFNAKRCETGSERFAPAGDFYDHWAKHGWRRDDAAQAVL